MRRDDRRFTRAARRAFREVMFYREQWAAAGAVLTDPEPTATTSVPDPPHTLCPFARPWTPSREPPLWTPDPAALARSLRLAGCDPRRPVLEIRAALLDRTRLPRAGRRLRGPGYGVLLGAAAVVASPAHRWLLNRAAIAAATATGPAWLVGSPEEVAEITEWIVRDNAAGRYPLCPVHRLTVAAIGATIPADGQIVLHEAVLGYLGARRGDCGEFHLDVPRVHARERGGRVTFSLPGSRRPTLLAMVPPGTGAVTVDGCPRHRTPILRPAQARTPLTATAGA